MKIRSLLFLGLFWPALLLAKPEVLHLTGTLTNTSAGDVSAPAKLELTIEGETVRARLTTEKPLTGSGELTGRLLGGWLELGGRLDEGFKIQFRGALSPVDYRDTYVAAPEDQLAQYGRFELARPAAKETSATAP